MGKRARFHLVADLLVGPFPDGGPDRQGLRDGKPPLPRDNLWLQLEPVFSQIKKINVLLAYPVIYFIIRILV
jgi:hypothetical protein